MNERLAPSVLSSWTRTIIDALAVRGVDPQAVLVRAGFSRQSFADPNARYPVHADARLWSEASLAAGDPAFGLEASRHIRPTTFHALGYAVLASATLGDALHRLVRYSHIVSDGVALQLRDAPRGPKLCWVPQPCAQLPSAAAMDAVMSLIVRTCRTMTDRSFALLLVEQCRSRPERVAPYEKFFRCPIEFEAAQYALSFDSEDLERPLPAANPELARHNDEAVQRYLAGMSEGTVVDRLRAWLASHLCEGEVTPQEAAAALGLSQRSLQRRLSERGTSYVAVLNDLRSELACSYLREARYSVSEVAFMLGFEGAGAFTRAFRRWTGETPSHHRTQLRRAMP